jgi:hypothetical protein
MVHVQQCPLLLTLASDFSCLLRRRPGRIADSAEACICVSEWRARAA